MSLSEEDRCQDVIKALTLMLSKIGDQAIDSVEFERRQPPYDELHRTTWEELRKNSYIEPWDYMSKEAYRLTGDGWLAAVRFARVKQDEEFKSRVEKLFAELKKSVDGRHDAAWFGLTAFPARLAFRRDGFLTPSKAGCWKENTVGKEFIGHQK